MSAFVGPEWMQEHLGDSNVRVIEASIAKESYDDAHIPGAQWCDHFAHLLRSGDDSAGDVLTPAQYAALMSRYGITPETIVVWYGDRHNSYAIRGFWTMDFYRHPGPFHVLEGGRERWLAEGRPVTRDVVRPPPARYPEPASPSEANRATWQQVRDAIGAGDRVILDVRAEDEYDGTNVRAKHGGHIPSAVHIEWTDATAGDNVLKPTEELRALYASQGVTPDKEVLAHCQLGVRAVHTWFVLKHVLGYPNVRNYDGSWAEWGNRDDLPIE
ncbi:MAG: sulfurtransferase [Chloroflexi bacterium]|nr:sulfurtransferase [Chloroflexota bacterium]